MKDVEEAIDERIARLERIGALDPLCPTCDSLFYPALLAGKDIPFAPGHKPSLNCKSGKRPHCTCDRCF